MGLRQDVTFAARLLRRNPVFTATAVLSLAIGIAANAAIFSLADALLLRARPGIAGPDGLVDVGRTQDGQGFDNLSYPNYVDFRDRNTVFTGLLREDGWTLIRQRGSHRQFAHPVKPGLVTVSGSANDDIHPGTLNNIRTQAGLKELAAAVSRHHREGYPELFRVQP